MRGVWTEESKGWATKEERYCPMARELESCPRSDQADGGHGGRHLLGYQSDIVARRADRAALHRRQLLPASFGLDYLGDEAAKESPQATARRLPARPQGTGPAGAHVCRLPLGSLKALLEMATTDIGDRDTLWYEKMRYEKAEA